MAHPSENDIVDVLLRSLTQAPMSPPLLVAGDLTGRIRGALANGGMAAEAWLRRGGGAAWPPAGPFASAILRLPRAKRELEMSLHAIAGVLAGGAKLRLYGANDEGIRSAAEPLAALLGNAETIDTRGHCRIIEAPRPAAIAGLKPYLADWRETREIEINGRRHTFATYPGLFADGALDPATALLIEGLPAFAQGSRILDFGCGVGIIGRAVLDQVPSAEVVLVDNDAAAVAAAAENVPGAEVQLIEAPEALRQGNLDAILSNPPIHAGKAEDHAVLMALIEVAADRLKLNGVLQIVVQRRVDAVTPMLAAFGNCETIGEDGTFRVLRAVRMGERRPVARLGVRR